MLVMSLFFSVCHALVVVHAMEANRPTQGAAPPTHLQALDVGDELVLLLRHALVVHAVEVALFAEAVPGCARTCCHPMCLTQLRPQRSYLLFKGLSDVAMVNGGE